MITEDDVWRRNACLFIEAQLHALTGDLPALTRTSEAMAALASKFEGWAAWLAWTRAALYRLRGELRAAAAELTAALIQAPAGEHRAWILIAPAHAELLLLQGDAEGALHEADEILATIDRLALDMSAAVSAERVRALAQSSRADHESARQSMERAFMLASEFSYDGLPLALLYEAQAKIALAASDSPACMTALERLRELIQHADAPALINAYEALREESSRQLTIAGLPESVSGTQSVNESTMMYTEVQTRLAGYDSGEQRTRQALQLLIDDSGAHAGQLFLFIPTGCLSLLPSVHRSPMRCYSSKYNSTWTRSGAAAPTPLASPATPTPVPLVIRD